VELASIHEERGDFRPAVEVLRRAVAEEPTHEEAHVGLMRLYTLSERRGEALSQYERLREALSVKFGAKPHAATRLLREEIATGGLPSAQPPTVGPPPEEAAEAGKHNLPATRSSFVGREREMVEVRRELAMTRLLTLTGTGGCGKTRLALEVARELVGAYPDGVWLVELAPLSEGALAPQALAAALGVQEQPERSVTDTLVDFLRKKKTLLVLDNCEHLMDALARLADILLNSCPHLRVLATSRETLDVEGELNWLVPSLSVPDSQQQPAPEELERYESVRLFVERARYRNPAFSLTSENAQAVAKICGRLDGIPLAIELAAARVGFSVEQIATRLDDSLRLLTAGSRTASPRQRTLRGALDWSYDLLSKPERVLFGRLSVFAGGWTLEAAEAVGSGEGIEEEDVLDLVSRLVDKSLVVLGTTAHGVVRYRMLEPVRQYAQEKLEASGEAEELRRVHAQYYLQEAEAAEPELARPQQRLWVERLEEEHDNLREALSWVLERGEAELGLRFGGALWRFWNARGYLGEGRRWLEEALAGSDPALARVKALEGMGWLVQLQGDSERAEATYEEMLKLSRELGDKGNTATALNSLGALALARGDNERAKSLLEENMSVLRELENERNIATLLKKFHVLGLLGMLALNEESDPARATALWEESLALAREVGDVLRVGMTLSNLGYAALLQGDHERARALCEETLAFAHELGSAGMEILPEALVNLGLAALGQGEHERAAASFKEALAVSQEAGRKPTVINTLEGMASLAGALGEATRATRLWGAAEASREVTGIALPPGERALHEPYLAVIRSQLGEVVWEEALAEGRAMSLDRAAEYALSREETEPSTTPVPEEPPAGEPVGKLTRREQEVALLVARGLTNRQISTKLAISERTAANHVARILSKLGLRSRAQIATWATERQLLTAPDPD